jgi:hypothetical protein
MCKVWQFDNYANAYFASHSKFQNYSFHQNQPLNPLCQLENSQEKF